MKYLLSMVILLTVCSLSFGGGLNTYDGLTYVSLIAPQSALTNNQAVTGTGVSRASYKGIATFAAYAGSTGAGSGGYVKLQTAANSTGVWADVSGISATPATNSTSKFQTFQVDNDALSAYVRAIAIVTNSAGDAVGAVNAELITY